MSLLGTGRLLFALLILKQDLKVKHHGSVSLLQPLHKGEGAAVPRPELACFCRRCAEARLSRASSLSQRLRSSRERGEPL
eukprot:CAMPEP_0169427562 /NCGR_PEP_ID=MMETSP1042-20121227/842_1 /TAXON_ID=464988 /ORGANISM="Hemiselmis andersenii, Strain CCMP1180" /LENGTH=79 /DNA_ID=CAMNT_0009537639 /DNA_START=249 /DNA_END=485 /DNA_ORIENTATION=+